MDIKYKPATVNDVDVIFRSDKLLIDQYENIDEIDYQEVLLWVRRKIETHIAEFSRVLVNDKIAGYFYFHLTDGKMEIDDLYVLPEYRDQGIGTEIIRKCISETDLPIFLYTFIRNHRAVSLYERLGFRITKTLKDSRYVMEL